MTTPPPARVEELFHAALEQDKRERAAFLERECGDDNDLLRALQHLIAATDRAEKRSIWSQSALQSEAEASVEMARPSASTFDRYRVLEQIGAGGMGIVYKAVRADDEFSKLVAIKIVQPGIETDVILNRFRQERQILAGLEHPNIARLLDGGSTREGRPFLVMEYVDGVPIDRYLSTRKPATPEFLALFRTICGAVAYAHRRLVVHRDLKPSNILVTADGEPKLLDFGIAKLVDGSSERTQTGMAALTPDYASPEQVRGETMTTASDVYALGVLLYRLLSGRPPYGDTKNPLELADAICHQKPEFLGAASGRHFHADIENIVGMALRKEPERRYGSVEQMSEDIRLYLDGYPVSARPATRGYRIAKFVQRNKTVVLATVLVMASITGGVVATVRKARIAERRFNQVRQLAHSVMFDYADAIDRLPGATPVRARLVKDALTYLDNLQKEADTPELQREVVNAYVRVSNVQGNEYQNNLGDPAAALASARKAVAAAEKLLREDRLPLSLDSAAEAFSTYGDLFFSTGDLAATDRAYQRAISLRQEIAAKSPRDLDNNLALSMCFRHMADLYAGYGWPNLGKTAESIAYHQQAKALAAKLVEQSPGNVDVAKASYKALLSLSSSESVLGRHDEAAKDLDEALRQIQEVSSATPGDANARVELAIAEERLGQMLLDDRNAAGALPHMARSAELLQQLVDADPGNAIYRRRQSTTESQWAAALRGAGQTLAAIEHNKHALSLAQALSRDAPGSAQYRGDVGVIERQVSEGLLAAGDAVAALRHAKQAEAILCKNAAGWADAYTLANCGRSLLAAGNAQLALSEPTAAVGAYREAVKIASARSQSEPLNAIFRSDWARAQGALAAGCAKIAAYQEAERMYEAALKNWGILGERKALSPFDAHCAETALEALTALGSRAQ